MSRGRREQLRQKIHDVLVNQWDPLSVKDNALAQDEYDSYIPGIQRMLDDGCDAYRLSSHLDQLETVSMGFARALGARECRCNQAAGHPAVRDNPPLERTAAAVYFTCGRASCVRRLGRSTAIRYPAQHTPMRRFDYDFTATVSVDGIVRDQRTIWAHQQEDPYPGGHRYELVLAGRGALEHLEGLPLDATKRLDGHSAHHFLQLIYWALEAPVEGVPREFVLNTIDAVRTEKDTVWISGECSPFVRTRSDG